MLDGAVRAIVAALPPQWSVQGDWQGKTVTIESPGGQSAVFEVVAGRAGKVPASAVAVDVAPGMAGTLYMSDYISAPVREKLVQAGLSYADATGWIHLVSDDPMLAITARGATKSPMPSRNAVIARLDGRSAGRVVRVLLTALPPLGVRELAGLTDVSPGTVSKVLPTFSAENAIQRDDTGRVTAVDRREVLRRWTADYQVLRSNMAPAFFVAPRGVDDALAKIAELPGIAVTGGPGGRAWLPSDTVPVVPVTQAVIYAAHHDQVAALLGLVAVESSAANVIVLAPQDPAILISPIDRSGIPVAPLPIVLADLLTLPGRYPQPAEALIDALAKTDPAWEQ